MPKLKEKKKYENPIIDEHRGHFIRRYNIIMLRVNEKTYKKFIDAKLDFNLSHKDAIIQNKVNIK